MTYRKALAVVALTTAMNLIANSVHLWREGAHEAWLLVFLLGSLCTFIAVAALSGRAR